MTKGTAEICNDDFDSLTRGFLSLQRVFQTKNNGVLVPICKGLYLTEQEVLSFVAESLRSVWALEVLLLLRSEGSKAWRVEEIIRETRSSQMAVGDAVLVLQKAGLVVQENGLYRYWPATPNLEVFAAEIQKLYAVKPTSVIKTILGAPHDKLRNFSDAFKLKE